jgi:hypothetical protein
MSEEDVEPDNLKRRVSKELFVNFFFIVGYAITRWAHIDAALFKLCTFALGAGDEKTAQVFYRSPQIGDHLALTDKLMLLALSPTRTKLRNEWKQITRDILEHLPFRNHLAHNPPFRDTLTLASYLQQGGDHFDAVWTISTEKTKLLAKKADVRSTFTTILAHSKAADTIIDRLDEFQKKLPKRPRKPRAKREAPNILPGSGSKKQKPRRNAKP